MKKILLKLAIWSMSASVYGQYELSDSDLDKPPKIEQEQAEQSRKQAEEAEQIRVASSTTIRRFHEVLDELLAEFGFDIKTGQLNGLKNLAIRKVEVSDALPTTYRKYLKMLAIERIRDNAKVKIINCILCEAKASKIVEGKIVITSPSTNLAQLKTAADRLGINNFMDIILVYHSTHMVLAFQIFDSASSEMIWTRTYNSETIRSRFQKLAVDYRQVAKSRPGEDYTPEYRILVGLGGAMVPNVGGDENNSSMLALDIRSTERFDNRHQEFGMYLSLYSTIASLLSAYPILEGTGSGDGAPAEEEIDPDITNPPQPEPFTSAFNLQAIYVYNFIGSIESYNQLRHGLVLGAGAILASGYIAGSMRLGWDMHFGRRFSLNIGSVYIAPSRILLENEYIDTKGGAGGSAVVSYSF